MSGAVRALRNVSRHRPVDPRCEVCSALLGADHGHVADVTEQRLLCACRACTLLFAPEGAAAGRYRVVAGDVRSLDGTDLDDDDWDALGVPVDVVFFLTHADGTVVACYPGPAGSVESVVDPEAWRALVEDHPALAAAAPDVEAVLLRRDRRAGRVQEGYLLPVDRCYALVGLVRTCWRGPGGGAEVWSRLDRFFEELESEASRRGDAPS